MVTRAVLISLALLVIVASPAWAKFTVKGEGKAQQIVVDDYPADQKARYSLFRERCTKCHAISRPIMAIRTGITPVSGGDFDDRGIKKYVVKMMRKPNSGIDKAEARELLLFLRYARKLAVEE